MQLTVIGAGYVGLVSAACFADLGNTVVCVDHDVAKIEMLVTGDMPIYEPGLDELVAKNVATDRLRFSIDLMAVLADSDVVFIAVGTPIGADGAADTSAVTAVLAQIGTFLNTSDCRLVIVNKSTVPVGCAAASHAQLIEMGVPEDRFDVVSNPEFLREGSSVQDFFRPDRVVIGGVNREAMDVVAALYRPLYRNEAPVVFTSWESSELIKYASNAFLATKISFINDIANLCDRVGADVRDVAKGMGADGRIGKYFLHPGPGYGGACFPKDTQALIHIADQVDYDLKIVAAAEAVNQVQYEAVLDKLSALLGGVSGCCIGVLGLAFKPNTDDVRQSPALRVIEGLLALGVSIQVYDPIAMDTARQVLGDRVAYMSDSYAVAAEMDAVVLMTEWNEFRFLDLVRLKSVMHRAVFVDARNVVEPVALKAAGFDAAFVGRPS